MTHLLRQSSRRVSGSSFEIPEMDEETFSYIVTFISRSARFAVKRSSRALVMSRLWKHVRSLGAESWCEYREILKSSGASVQQEMLNLLTTNKTDFFREVKHFDHIESALVQRTGFAASCGGVLNVWVAACSRGHEAYTLALVLRDCQSRCPWLRDFRILATDIIPNTEINARLRFILGSLEHVFGIRLSRLAFVAPYRTLISVIGINTDVLAIAAEGVYPAEEVDGAIAKKYQHGSMLRGTGQNSGKYRFADELKQHIKFRQHNLIEAVDPPSVTFDLIMVRNVFIYFNEHNIVSSVNSLMRNLKNGGELIIGLCEAMPSGVKGLSALAPSDFRKGS